MTENSGTKLIVAFVALIIGVVLVGTIASNSNDVTEKNVVVDETFNLASGGTGCYGAVSPFQVQVNDSTCNLTVANRPTTWKVTDCPIGTIIIENASGTALTLNTDYRVYASQGIIQMLNTTATNSSSLGNNTLVNYNYCPDSYMNSSFGRSITNLIAGFFAIICLVVSVGLFYSVAKDEGILNI